MSDKNDILQDLNLIPDWARQPAGGGVQINVSHAGGGGRPERRFEQRSGARPPRHTGRPDGGRGRPHNPAHADAARMRPRYRNDEEMPDDHRGMPAGMYRINFIPERRGLKPLVNQLARTHRAWPLNDVAKMFLSKPDFYAVKLEVAPPGGADASDAAKPPALFQCAECQQVFQTRDAALNHAIRRHFELYFDMEEQPGETPKGNFAIVARCGLSGILLGPPNYHLYNEKIQDVHRQRFPDMPMEAYRRQIVNETDPALLEQWKQEVSRQTLYRTKRETEPREFKRQSEAESFFNSAYAPALVREGQRFIIPGTVVQNMEDQGLQHAIKQIWLRENRSPMRITLAVRPAFKQLGLHVFRAPDKIVFVTSIPPRPLGDVQTTPEVSFILQYVTEHPNCTMEELTQAWASSGMAAPGADAPSGPAPDTAPIKDGPADAAKPTAIALPLRWLTDKGHIIEFFNGKLVVPSAEDQPHGAPSAGADVQAGQDKTAAAGN